MKMVNGVKFDPNTNPQKLFQDLFELKITDMKETIVLSFFFHLFDIITLKKQIDNIFLNL